MKAFLERNYWYDYCKIAFMNKNTHRCKFVCNSCRSFNCDNSSVDRFPKPLQCENCSKLLFSDACTLTHLLEFCKKAKRCEQCQTILTAKHVCGTDSHWCYNCSESVKQNHQCYIKKDSKKTQLDKPFSGYVFLTLKQLKILKLTFTR